MSVKLRSLELCNIGPYSGKHVFEFAPHFTSITGPNGSGKSTILESIVIGMTGRFKGRNKGDWINVSSGSKDEAWIKLTLERLSDNALIEVTRYLQPTTRHVVRVNGQTLGNRLKEEVDAFMEGLGLSVSNVQNVLYVPQWHMFDWLILPPAEQLKLFIKVFGLDEVHERGNRLSEVVKKIPELVAPLDELAKTKEFLEKIEEAKREHEQKLAEIGVDEEEARNKIKELEKEIEELLARKSEAELAQKAREKLEQVRTSLRELDIDSSGTAAELADRVGELIKATEEKLKEAGIVSMLQLEISRRDEEAKEIFKEIERLSKDILDPAEEQSLRDELGKAEKELEELAVLRDRLEVALQSVQRGECLVCRTELDDQKKADIMQRIQSLEVGQEAVNQVRKKIEEIKDKLSKGDRIAAVFKEKYDRLQKIMNEMKRLNKRLEGYDTNLDEEALDRLMNRLKSISSELNWIIYTDADATPVDENEIEEKKAELASLRAKVSDIALAKAKIESAEQTANEIRERIKSMQDVIDSADDHNKARADLQSIARFFSHDGLGRLALEHYTRAVEEATNDILGAYGSDLSIVVDGSFDGSIYAILPNKERVHVRNLSGGQKVLVAIAMRIAVIRMLDLPHIILMDEPAAGLDDNSISILRGILSDLSSGSDLQVVMSTHDERILPPFHKHIRLIGYGTVSHEPAEVSTG